MLIVDDEEIVLRVAALLLESSGFRVLTAAGGVEALAVYAGDPADAALVDLVLPDRGGGDVARDLRRLRPDLPVVISSGYDEETMAESVGDLRDVAFIRKPYSASDLVALLHAAIDGSPTRVA